MYKYQMCHLSDLYHENKLLRFAYYGKSVVKENGRERAKRMLEWLGAFVIFVLLLVSFINPFKYYEQFDIYYST